jgi:two-component system OmpR family sensor kinase
LARSPRLSLRARLLIAVGLVAMVALAAADVTTYSELNSFLLSRVDQQLQAAHLPIEQNYGRTAGQTGPGPVNPGGPDGAPGFLPNSQFGTFVEVLTSSGTLVTGTVHPYYLAGGTEVAPKLPAKITGFSHSEDPDEPVVYFDASSAQANGPQFRVRASVMNNGDILILAIPSDVHDTLNRLLLVELAVTGAALALSALIGLWLVRLGLRPLRNVERTAAAIAGGQLDERVPGETDRTEIGRLAIAFNAMITRIQQAFAARDATEAELRRSEGTMRRFVADASHELRTPLAAVSAYAELFERGADRRPEDLGRVMTGIRSETARMGHLVDDLLLLARIDEGRPLERAPVELVGLASEAVDAARAVGPQWPVSLAAAEPVEVTADRVRLRQVVDNLLANVRAHTPAGTNAVVRVSHDGPWAVIAVEDDGPGVAPEHAARLFERFYRPDASRSRSARTDGAASDSAGSGLGLSIVRAIAAAHGGTVDYAPGQAGSVFSVRLPLG